MDNSGHDVFSNFCNIKNVIYNEISIQWTKTIFKHLFKNVTHYYS